jgi:hypothetical protein
MAFSLAGTPLLHGRTREVNAAASDVVLVEVRETLFCSDRYGFHATLARERRQGGGIPR